MERLPRPFVGGMQDDSQLKFDRFDQEFVHVTLVRDGAGFGYLQRNSGILHVQSPEDTKGDHPKMKIQKR